MKNPWLNISLSDTVADCDKSVINSLTTAVKSKIVLDALPEPYHGDPEAKVYLLNGNPGHSEKDLTFVGCGNAIQAASVLPNGKNAFSNIYEKEICICWQEWKNKKYGKNNEIRLIEYKYSITIPR